MSEIAKRIEGVVRAGLAPLLKGKGFRKKGGSYYRSDGGGVVSVVNVQLSQGNSANEGRFTLNLGKYFPAVAQLEGMASDLEFPKEYECTVRRRIGELMPGHTDHWWRIDAATDEVVMAQQLVEAARDLALPWLNSLRGYAELRRELAAFPSLTAAGAELLDGDPVAAAGIAQAFIQERPRAEARARSWAARHGLTLD